jgi:hypothetical protein
MHLVFQHAGEHILLSPFSVEHILSSIELCAQLKLSAFHESKYLALLIFKTRVLMPQPCLPDLEAP